MYLFASSFKRQLFVLGIILVFGILFLSGMMEIIEEKEREATRARLEKAHQQALVTFEDGIERFATLISGIRAYMVASPDFPTQNELQDFVAHQLRDIKYTENLTVSFVDTAHVFRYSFDKDVIDPVGLVGTSVKMLRNQVEIDRLNAMLQDEHLHLSQPINLLEGFVGLPITFSVVKDGKVLGYIAAIIDFNALVTSLYEVNDEEEFVYRFSVGNLLDFDRARVHDGSRVYHDQIDSSYYQYYDLEQSDFLYSTLNLYGLEFQIGSAPVGTLYASSANEFLSILLYGWYILLITFFGFSLYRLMKFRKLNIRLQDSNRTIRQQTNQLETQNAELKQVVHTKDKLFSIIGHDLKSPLNSLITIVNLAESDRITAEETKNFVHDVGEAARHNLSLLDNLLRWSMQNSGADRVRKMDLRLFDMVQDTSDQLEMVAKTKQINIVNEVDQNLMLQADYEMISTILRNLISNAIKFSYPEDSILVDAKIEKDTVILSVTDTGVGMTQDELNALFHTGSDVVRRGTNDEPGTGLGLVVVRDFIEKHDGELIIHSKEGKGSTFEVKFPNGWIEGDVPMKVVPINEKQYANSR